MMPSVDAQLPWQCRFAGSRERLLQEPDLPEQVPKAQAVEEAVELNEYEMQRLANIERNRLRLASIMAGSVPQAA